MIRFLCPFFAAIILHQLHRQRLWLDLHVNEYIKSKKPHRPPRKGIADVVFYSFRMDLSAAYFLRSTSTPRNGRSTSGTTTEPSAC